MSEELRNREDQVRSGIVTLLAGVDASVRELYESLLEVDANNELTEEQSVARLEGFHDYIVVREALGVEHPTLNDFLDVRRANPESLLSFGTGRRRAGVAESVDVIDDTLSDEEYADEAGSTAVEEAMREKPEQVVVGEVVTDVYVSPIHHGVVDHTESPDEIELTKYVSEGGAVSDALSANSPDETQPDEEDQDEVVDQDEADVSNGEALDEEFENESEKDTKGSNSSESVPGRIDANAVATKEFATKRGGYNLDQVDDLLDEVAEFLKEEHSVEEYQTMVVQLEANHFKSSPFTKGFNQVEVDGFVEAVISELRNLSAS